jgi:DNA-binding PadR family transcriptional regulator
MDTSVRITYPTAAVLCALAHGHEYGFEIIDVTGLRAGTVYPILRRLESDGLVRSTWEPESVKQAEGRPPRRNYRLTGAGSSVVETALGRYPALRRLFGPLPGAEPAAG